MFGFLKKKSPRKRLEREYQDLIAESHRLSTTDRRAADEKMAQANEVLTRLEKLDD